MQRDLTREILLRQPPLIEDCEFVFQVVESEGGRINFPTRSKNCKMTCFFDLMKLKARLQNRKCHICNAELRAEDMYVDKELSLIVAGNMAPAVRIRIQKGVKSIAHSMYNSEKRFQKCYQTFEQQISQGKQILGKDKEANLPMLFNYLKRPVIRLPSYKGLKWCKVFTEQLIKLYIEFAGIKTVYRFYNKDRTTKHFGPDTAIIYVGFGSFFIIDCTNKQMFTTSLSTSIQNSLFLEPMANQVFRYQVGILYAFDPKNNVAYFGGGRQQKQSYSNRMYLQEFASGVPKGPVQQIILDGNQNILIEGLFKASMCIMQGNVVVAGGVCKDILAKYNQYILFFQKFGKRCFQVQPLRIQSKLPPSVFPALIPLDLSRILVLNGGFPTSFDIEQQNRLARKRPIHVLNIKQAQKGVVRLDAVGSSVKELGYPKFIDQKEVGSFICNYPQGIHLNDYKVGEEFVLGRFMNSIFNRTNKLLRLAFDGKEVRAEQVIAN